MNDDATQVIEHLQLQANGLRFYAAASGPADAPLVLLLHGFPELSYGWRHQLAPLAAAGLRVVAPDQRGYGHSDRPRGRRAYGLDALADDVVGLAHALGHERFAVVGHDWGGIVAWHLAATRAGHLERLAVLNAPHLAAARRHLLASPTQLLRSAYVGFFQWPLVPEWVLAASNHAVLAAALTRSSLPGTFSDDELRVYREAWSKPGALEAMLHWYRALPLHASTPPTRIATPTLVLWGDRDTALEPALAERSAAFCDDAVVEHVPDATHWLHHEKPALVNARLVAFLRGAQRGGPTSGE